MPDATERPPLAPATQHLLQEEVVLESVAPMPNPAAGSGVIPVGVPATLYADALTEYVGIRSSAYTFAEALPSYIDDITRDFGSDLYERMALDPQIAGDTNVYKLSVLANGVRLLPSHDDDKTDVAKQREHQKALQVLAFCEACLNELDTPLPGVLDDMLSAFGQGNRCAEIVYRRDGSFLMPDRLRVKPRESTAYVVDSRGRLVALLGAIAGQANVVVKGSIVTDPRYTPNILPRKKFAVLSWRPVAGDPRGTSAYRPAYNPWWQKRQTEVEYAKYICQFAGGIIFANVGGDSQKAVDVPVVNPDGSPVKDRTGKPLVINPQTALRNGLITAHNGGVVVGPPGSDAKILVTEGGGATFLEKLRWHDQQISKALLGQTLATNEGEHQTRASSGNAKDIQDLLVLWGEQSVAAMIRRDILRPAVELNFGPAFLPYLPTVSLSAVEEADWAPLAIAAAKIGYTLDGTQLPQMDMKLGMEPRDDEAVERALVGAAAASNDPNDSNDSGDEDASDDEDTQDGPNKKKFALFPSLFGRKKKAAP